MRKLLGTFGLWFALLGLIAVAHAEPARRPGRQLVQTLITLADSGRLTDPAYVSQLLGMAFTAHVSTQEPFAHNCAPGYRMRPSVITSHDPIRLDPTPFGKPSITRPGFGVINSEPAEISGPTQVHYFLSENHDCSGYVQSNNELTAQLDIGPLSTYDCIAPGEIEYWFPKIVRGYATDGAEIYYYESEASHRTGSTLIFRGFAMTECLLSVSLAQSPSDSLHYQAAKQKQAECMLPHEAAFCRSHAPFGWGDGDIQDEMAAYAVRQCGALDKFLALTPANARPIDTPLPPGTVDPQQSTPCSRINAMLAARPR